jgi:hypothetical protein
MDCGEEQRFQPGNEKEQQLNDLQILITYCALHISESIVNTY